MIFNACALYLEPGLHDAINSPEFEAYLISKLQSTCGMYDSNTLNPTALGTNIKNEIAAFLSKSYPENELRELIPKVHVASSFDAGGKLTVVIDWSDHHPIVHFGSYN